MEGDATDFHDLLNSENNENKDSNYQNCKSEKIDLVNEEDNNELQINQGVKSKDNEEPKTQDIYEPMSKGNIFLMVGILIFIVIIVVVVVALYFINKSNKEDSNKKEKTEKKSRTMRLKNWEFTTSVNLTNKLTPEQISRGDRPDLFSEAPKDFYVCTAMGGLSGDNNNFFFETNLRDVDQKQFDVDWWFRSHFDLDLSSYDGGLILLHINGINYKSDVYIDGKLVEEKDKIIGTFVKYTLDITNFIDKNLKTHYVAFDIDRPHNHWRISNETDLAISFVDWNPEAPDSNMGIWQPVDVEIFDQIQLTVSSAFVKTEIAENRINLEIILHIKNWEEKSVETSFTVQIGNFIRLKVKALSFEPLEEKQIVLDSDSYRDLSIKYDAEKLWWPYQMGKQTMHTLTIKFSNYEYTKQVGFKQIESEYDEELRIVVYKINQKKILLKGAGWTPDLFLRQSPENYYNHIKYVRDMGLNVIRLEGKSEGEEFYEYCDKMGILVIPGWNCADAWQRWKLWDETVRRLSDKSVISQIRKLAPHPSVIIFILGSDYGPTNGVEERWRDIFEKEKWPNEILSSAAASSKGDEYPTGVKMSGPYSWVPPNYFFLEKTRSNNYGGAFGFLSEGGPGENPLRLGSIEKVFSKDNLTAYEGDSWNYHCGNKKVFGDLTKLTNPIKERFGLITDFDDFMRKSSAIVYESHRAMYEAYECFRYKSTGVIQWMLNNAWPSNIWHLYDYFMTPTPAYFATKKATEKIHGLYNYDDYSVYLTNNFFYDFDSNINLDIYVIDKDGKNILKKINKNIVKLNSDETQKIETINDYYDNNCILHLEYSYNDDGKNILLTNTYFLNKKMDVLNYTQVTFYNIGIIEYADLKFLDGLQKVSISASILSKDYFEEGDKKKVRYNLKIENKGDAIALLLEMKIYHQTSPNDENREIIVPIIWSDNYFSIRGKKSYETTAEFDYNENIDNKLYLDIVGWNCELNQKLN